MGHLGQPIGLSVSYYVYLLLTSCTEEIVECFSDVIAGPNVELDPASVGYISMCDALTGYWQIGIEDQPRWSWITLTYPQRLQRRL